MRQRWRTRRLQRTRRWKQFSANEVAVAMTNGGNGGDCGEWRQWQLKHTHTYRGTCNREEEISDRRESEGGRE